MRNLKNFIKVPVVVFGLLLSTHAFADGECGQGGNPPCTIDSIMVEGIPDTPDCDDVDMCGSEEYAAYEEIVDFVETEFKPNPPPTAKERVQRVLKNSSTYCRSATEDCGTWAARMAKTKATGGNGFCENIALGFLSVSQGLCIDAINQQIPLECLDVNCP